MPLFGSICALFQTGDTKSLYTAPSFDPRAPVESRRFVRVNAASGGGGASSGGSKGGASSGGSSGGRGPGASTTSKNTGGVSSSTSKSTANVGKTTSATSSLSATTRGLVSSATGLAQKAATSISNYASSIARSPIGQSVANAYSSMKSAIANSSIGQKVAGAYSSLSGAYNSAANAVANSRVSQSVSNAFSSAKNSLANALGLSTPATSTKTGVTATATAKIGTSLPANATATPTSAVKSSWSQALSSLAAHFGFSQPAANTSTTATTTAVAKPTTATPTGFVSDKVKAQYNSLMSALSSWSANQIGAGARTRKQNGMSNLGPDAASEAIAKVDEKRAQAVNSTFVAAEKVTGVPAVIGEAIASRETHVNGPHQLSSKTGMSLDPKNKGYGMMQVDQKAHPGTALGPTGVTSLQHVELAEKILNSGLNTVQMAHPNWSAADDLRAAIDRYNGGLSNNPSALDRKTTMGDYGGDVLGRAQQFNSDGLGQ